MTKTIELSQFTPETIRNFSIIAHIDHGKSTLCDRLLEETGTISTRQKNTLFLDKLQVEKERGITIKAQTATMIYKHNGKEYLLNLIDTPGHVDFNYEVTRSLYACQGAILLVDATQGVQAQTMANFYLAFEQNLEIIPVVNKIDVASADPETVSEEIELLFDLKKSDNVAVSAKTGTGIHTLLERIITTIPHPEADRNKPFKALLFDSYFDKYKGVISLLAIKSGSLKKGDIITTHHAQKNYEILEIGIMYPEETPTNILYAGQVGYIICGMKTVQEAKIGETLYIKNKPCDALPGFKQPKHMVFAGIFPVENQDFPLLQDAIEKLTLNDASVSKEKTGSDALGVGFRCGFLGLLHMDVFQQRLQSEYNISVIATSPSVLYKIELTSGQTVFSQTPSGFPERTHIAAIYEPMVKATIIAKKNHIGSILELCKDKRGALEKIDYLGENRVVIQCILPLNEIIIDFYDELKSKSSGYASLDYEEHDYQKSSLVKMEILINGSSVDTLALIVHESKAQEVGRLLIEKLKKIIDRQLYEVIIQAAIGSKIVARSTISGMRKDVIAKCYGGDITRKRKLLEKQKEGKKKMKRIGKIDIPKEAFLALLQK
jgi:elongation factor 4